MARRTRVRALGAMVARGTAFAARRTAAFVRGGGGHFGGGHLAFAAGPHKCLGTHLARREMNIALEEWHKRIPHYRAVQVDELRETGPQLGLEDLWLEWDVAE